MKLLNLLLAISILSFTACKDSKNNLKVNDDMGIDLPEQSETSETTDPLLADVLKTKKDGFLKSSDKTKINDYEEGIKAVAASGVLENALNVGDIAPDFTLTNAKGDSVSLYNELENGPVVMVWYRGGWCPYCNITLHYLQEKLPEFKAAGAQLMALSPELPDSSTSTQEKNELEFAVLSDVGNVVAKDYGVVYTLPEKIAEYYSNFGLNDYNGDESNQLPLAVTYVIGKDHKIKYAFLDADYRNRAEPNDIISALK